MESEEARAKLDGLRARHAEAKRQRDAVKLGSDAFRAAAEEVARIEIEIAQVIESSAPQR